MLENIPNSLYLLIPCPYFVLSHFLLPTGNHQLVLSTCFYFVIFVSGLYFFDFPSSSAGKESACNAGDPGLIPGSGRSPGEGIGYPLQYSWASFVAQLLKNPPAMQETLGLIPGLGRAPGEWHGNPLQISCLENPHGQRKWYHTVLVFPCLIYFT